MISWWERICDLYRHLALSSLQFDIEWCENDRLQRFLLCIILVEDISSHYVWILICGHSLCCQQRFSIPQCMPDQRFVFHRFSAACNISDIFWRGRLWLNVHSCPNLYITLMIELNIQTPEQKLKTKRKSQVFVVSTGFPCLHRSELHDNKRRAHSAGPWTESFGETCRELVMWLFGGMCSFIFCADFQHAL